MTRKDFALIADAFARTRPTIGMQGEDDARLQWEITQLAMENNLSAVHPGFQRDKFRAACNGKPG